MLGPRSRVILLTGLIVALGPDFVGAENSPGPVPGPVEAAALPPASPEATIRLSRITFEGNTVMPRERLEEACSGFLGRPLATGDLQTLQDALTRLYLEAGYANSWALLPDQDLVGGVLRVRIVEGRLVEVVITGNSGYSAAYLRERLLGDPDQPLNAFELERRIRLLQVEPGIRSIRGELRPGQTRDRAILFAEIDEAPRLGAMLDFGDIFNPLIGEMGGHLGISLLNPIAGRGDRFGVIAGLSQGLTDLQFSYALPVGRWGTRLEADFRYSQAEIVDETLRELDIQSRYMAGAIDISQPIWSGANAQVTAGLRTEWRASRSSISGFPFSFSLAADSDGEVRDFALRFYQNLFIQTGNDALAFRSTWSVGLNALGATSSSTDRADFAVWLGQAQWLKRLPESGVEFFARANVQLALDPLLPFERFSLGGSSSVRGYRQNQEVRDNGYSLGLEARFPLIREPSGRTVLRAGPFVDTGRSWTEQRGEDTSRVDLASIGVEAVWTPTPQLSFQFIYGIRLIPVPERGEVSLQDHGVEFRVVAGRF
jgi:hemolysin activation/secretion protein